MEGAGWLWLITDVVAVIVLGGATVYGAYPWRRRSRNGGRAELGRGGAKALSFHEAP